MVEGYDLEDPESLVGLYRWVPLTFVHCPCLQTSTMMTLVPFLHSFGMSSFALSMGDSTARLKKILRYHMVLNLLGNVFNFMLMHVSLGFPAQASVSKAELKETLDLFSDQMEPQHVQVRPSVPLSCCSSGTTASRRSCWESLVKDKTLDRADLLYFGFLNFGVERGT